MSSTTRRCLAKKFQLKGRTNFELRVDVMNLFDNITFTPVTQTGAGATINQVTAAYTHMNQTWDPGGRLGQIVLRLNW